MPLRRDVQGITAELCTAEEVVQRWQNRRQGPQETGGALLQLNPVVMQKKHQRAKEVMLLDEPTSTSHSMHTTKPQPAHHAHGRSTYCCCVNDFFDCMSTKIWFVLEPSRGGNRTEFQCKTSTFTRDHDLAICTGVCLLLFALH